MTGNRQNMQYMQIDRHKRKSKYKNPVYNVCLLMLAAAVIQGGCSLALPMNQDDTDSDRLIGAFITREYLDLYDTDAFFGDHAGQLTNGTPFGDRDLADDRTRLYASVEKNGSHSPLDWEVSFPGAEGICFFSPLWPDENGGEYQGSAYDPRICEVSQIHSATTEGETLELTGTIYQSPKAGSGGDMRFYLNPVYQTPQGDIYLTSGTGNSVSQTDREICEGEQLTASLTAERKLTENGKTKTEKSMVTVKLAVMYEPVKITFCQMDAGHQVLKEETFDPADVPGQLDTQPETAYILSETEKKSPSGKQIVSRTVYENQEGEDSRLESFQTMENGEVLRKEVAVNWKES